MRLLASHMTLVVSLALFAASARADLEPGQLFDFEDGSIQDWSSPIANTTNRASGGPLGTGDNYLEIAEGSAHLAAFNMELGGVIDPEVTGIEVWMRRAEGGSDLAMRLVLFGPTLSDRWTSTDAQAVVGDGVWRSYTYSILEQDLTQVMSMGGSYGDLQSGFVQVMLRHQSGEPAATGSEGVSGVVDVDDILVLPEPAPASGAVAGLATLLLIRGRIRATPRSALG